MKRHGYLVIWVALIAIAAVAFAAGRGHGSGGSTVRAERFELVDEQGRLLGMLTQDATRGHGLELLDAQGRVRLRMQVKPDGTPELGLCDERGATPLLLSVGRRGEAGIEADSVLGHQSAWFGVTVEGRPGLCLRDGKATTRVEMTLAADGTPRLVLSDAAGAPRARLALHPADGSAEVTVTDAAQHVVWAAPAEVDEGGR